MVPASVVDSVLADLRPLLQPGDIIIDGGNSHYQDDIRRAKELKAAGIHYMDVGTSGGVLGLERGYCLMVGGEPGGLRSARTGVRDALTRRWQRRFAASEQGYLHCGDHGAGHFVKMVHNGIEYGLMAAYAEGFNILQHADAGLRTREKDAETAPLSNPEHFQFKFDLGAIAELWRHGSIIGSRLLDLTAARAREGSAARIFRGARGRFR